jgi:hypothetical protein
MGREEQGMNYKDKYLTDLHCLVFCMLDDLRELGYHTKARFYSGKYNAANKAFRKAKAARAKTRSER